MTILNRSAILGVVDLKTVDVDVPEWGGTVRLQSLTGAQRDAYSRSMIGADNKPVYDNYAAKLIAVSVVDETGALCFTLDDVEALAAKSAAPIQRLYEAASKLNGMTNGALEAAEGN